MRLRLIEDHRDVWPVRVMCDALSVSPSDYYAWRSRPQSPRAIANRELLVDIRRLHAQHRERYGAPRIHAELRAEGQTVSRKRVERVMRDPMRAELTIAALTMAIHRRRPAAGLIHHSDRAANMPPATTARSCRPLLSSKR
jgi:transposase InsO family protein